MEKVGTEVIDTPQSVAKPVDRLVSIHTVKPGNTLFSPVIYIDLEGVDLCREGSISILTLLVDQGPSSQHAYLIDVHTLDAQAFTTAGTKETTLKDILHDEKIPKVFFDVRNDSDALFAHYGVALQGVEDVQLMESATRETTGSRRYLSGLAKCIEHSFIRTFHDDSYDYASWSKAKAAGEKLFKAKHGGSYDVFNKRSVLEAIMAYCVGDVRCLPDIRKHLCGTRPQEWRDIVIQETKKRIASTHTPDYQPHGRERTLAP